MRKLWPWKMAVIEAEFAKVSVDEVGCDKCIVEKPHKAHKAGQK